MLQFVLIVSGLSITLSFLVGLALCRAAARDDVCREREHREEMLNCAAVLQTAE